MSVTVFGSLNLDIALRLPARAGWGQTLLVDRAEQAVGGKGLNQAVAAARFGAQVKMAGAVGQDASADLLLGALRAEGVDVSAVERVPGGSGRATILIAPDGENMIAVEPAANMLAQAGPARAALDAGTRVLLAQLENDIDAIAALFASDEAAGLRKILNTAPAVPGGEKLFAISDMLIFNQSEFATYLQLDSEPQTVDDLRVARKLLTRPDQAVVVTFGAAGAAAIRADRALFSAGLAAETVVDTSGAGDCFCGVVAACLDQGFGLEQALGLANAAASLSVGRPGAAPSMPRRAEVMPN
jgi:ribokinase